MLSPASREFLGFSAAFPNDLVGLRTSTPKQPSQASSAAVAAHKSSHAKSTGTSCA